MARYRFDGRISTNLDINALESKKKPNEESRAGYLGSVDSLAGAIFQQQSHLSSTPRKRIADRKSSNL
jgi:hypothetical protein